MVRLKKSVERLLKPELPHLDEVTFKGFNYNDE
jgi:hypothetical protein